MKKLALLMLLVFSVSNLQAVDVKFSDNVTINEPVDHDLYLSGGNIVINAPIRGDLIVAGGTIVVNDSVLGDIIMAGGTLTINGYVGDDIRCVGGTITLSRDVAGDLIAAGGTITVGKGVTINSVLLAGGELYLNGNIRGDVKGAFGKMVMNATVGGAFDVNCSELTLNGTVNGPSVIAAEEISLGSAAALKGDVRYWTRAGEYDFGGALQGGTSAYDSSLEPDYDHWEYLGFSSFLALIWYLGTVFIMIMIIQYLFSRTMLKAGATFTKETMRSLGYGLLFFFAVPVLAVLSMVTIIGVPVGILIMIAYVTLIFLAIIITSIVAANWLNSRAGGTWSYGRIILVAFGIFIGIRILSLIPVAGWLFILVVGGIAFGAILISIRDNRRGKIAAQAA